MRKSSGFTLLELLMVVIIIAILASIALPQYLKAMEKSRSAEAMQILGQIRAAENRYKAQSAAGVFSANTADLDTFDTRNAAVQQTQSWGNVFGNSNRPVVTAASSSLTRVGGIYANQILGMRHDNGAICGNFAVSAGIDAAAVACP